MWKHRLCCRARAPAIGKKHIHTTGQPYILAMTTVISEPSSEPTVGNIQLLSSTVHVIHQNRTAPRSKTCNFSKSVKMETQS